MNDASTVKIVGISGSLRRASFNSAALRAAQELAPAGMTIDIFDISAIQLYNEDVRAQGFPPVVADLRARIKAADGVLLATPEYNYATSGAMKNVIDWVSRPPEQPFDGKPIALIGASAGALGTARAQYNVRQMFIFLNAHMMNRPEVFIGGAASKFDAEGKLTDQATRDFLAAMLAAFKTWIGKVG
jgi:chromate reductase, NAD(P)H dehydrogenase (quinone)